MNEAIEVYLKSHVLSGAWEPIDGIIQDDGFHVVLLHNPEEPKMKYAVCNSCSGGKLTKFIWEVTYFETKGSALRYIVYRGWKWNFPNKNQYYKFRSQIKSAIKGLQEEKTMTEEQVRKTCANIIEGKKLVDADYMTLANMLGIVQSYLHCAPDAIKENEVKDVKKTSDEPTAWQLHEMLRDCDSKVTKDGEWKYDKVPSNLVEDLLFFLERMDKKGE